MKTKIYSFFALLLIAEVLSFRLMLTMQEASEENHRWVVHTYRVIQESERLLGHLRDAETGQRGYLLTNDKDYLEPYYSGLEETRKSLLTLVSLMEDNPLQQQSLVEIDQLINQKFKELELTIDLMQNDRKDEALKVVLSDEGKLVMDALRLKINVFVIEENRLLEIRVHEYHRLQSVIIRAFVLEAIVVGLVFIFFIWLAKKKLINPLSDLTRAANRFRLYTEYRPVTVKTKDEIGDLAMAFNAMGQAINQSAKKLIRNHEKVLLERDDAIYQAITDPLTGLNNRNYFYLQINQRIQASLRYEQPLGLLMLDIDHFKKINDEFGHSVGDEVLRQIGKTIKAETRASDMAIRYGGEEFIAVLTNTGIDKAESKADYLRESIENLIIPELKGRKVTISVGISQLHEDDTNVDEIINRADKALYVAKENGRNQVCVFEDYDPDEGDS